MFEVPEQADPTNPTEGPTNHHQKSLTKQIQPTLLIVQPINHLNKNKNIQPIAEMPSDDPTDEPPMVPPVATTTASSSIFHPKVPTMGGIIQVKHDTYSTWTGRKPLADWTGLDMSAHGYEQTAQLRPTYEDKGFQTRCTGFEAKFTKSSSFHLFQCKLLDHFVTQRMDSITYLLDPTEPMTVVNIITHHTRLTTDVVKLAAPMQPAKYDLYDHANNCATHLALVDCFDNALCLEIEERLPDDPTFHIVWMLFVQIVQSDSMGKTNEIKQQTPQMYASQNIAEMALAISTRATALSTAGLYDLQLNGTILKAFLLADGNDEYWFELMKMQSQLTAALKQVHFMADKHAASAFLTNLGLGHTQLFALTKGKYREAVGDGIWPPATSHQHKGLQGCSFWVLHRCPAQCSCPRVWFGQGAWWYLSG